MEQPPWLAAAWTEFGATEGEGSSDNPAIVQYAHEIGQGSVAHDETAWCAAFVGAMLARGERSHTGSLLARSYLNWGVKLSAAQLGAIAILERPGDSNAGHVGFVVGLAGERIFLLGGNQSNRVCVSAFDIKRVLSLRWPQELVAASIAKSPASTIFDRSLKHVLAMEGGFGDDPYDPGGPTNRGITLKDFAAWRGVSGDALSHDRLVDDLKRIPDDTVAAIYATRYWRPASCSKLPPPIALMHFDAAVNHGIGAANAMLQEAAGATRDGVIGPQTLAAVIGVTHSTLLDRYGELRRTRYRSLSTFWRFGKGWLARVEATLAAARAEIAPAENTSTQAKGDQDMNSGTAAQANAKWWLQSKTIWGALITAAATVVPVLGPLIGIELPGEVVRQAGEQTISAVQALSGLFGTLLTIYGRLSATAPLVRMAVSLKV